MDTQFWAEEEEVSSPAEELDDQHNESQDPPDAAADAILDEVEDVDQDAPLDGGVESRILLVQHYNTLLGSGYLFRERSPAADQVNREVRAFVRQKLGVLLGMVAPERQAPAAGQFSDAEASILRALAKAAIAKKFGAAPQSAAPPELKRAELPQQAPPPSLAAPPAPRRPVMAPKKRAPTVFQTKVDSQVLARLPDKYKSDPTLRIKGGRAFVALTTPDDGSRLVDPSGKVALREVTPPAVPVANSPQQPLPTPTEEAGMMIGATQAYQLANGVGGSKLLGGALRHSTTN